MPRIPVRTTPYHALPRCTRHYKSKRDLILRALGKASFINGSQFVIAWISPKGDTDIFASELLQSAVKDNKEGGGVLNKKELEKEALRVKQEMVRRWDEIKRMEEKGEQVPVLEDEDVEEGEEVDDEDPDKTMVDDEIDLTNLETPLKPTGLGISTMGKKSPNGVYSTFQSTTTTPASNIPMQSVVLKPEQIESFYMDRFTNLQQQTCKLVVKAWIKIIEPKKQMKFPYNKGEEFKPSWWPEGVKHREPDHLPKDERKLLLMSIIRNPSVNVARLQLSTAETSAMISASKLAILREIYIIAKEEERRRQIGDTTSDLSIELPISQSTSNGSPEPAISEKRSHSTLTDDKENIKYEVNPPKKQKTHPRLPGLTLQPQQFTTYDSPYTTSPSPFAYAPQQHLSPHIWGEARLSTASSSSQSHLSPYGYATSDVHSDYSRSPNPEQQQQQQRQYSNQHHLAPLLNVTNTHHSHSPISPIESPAFPHSANLQAQPTATYYQRPNPTGYMQQQQMEYLHQHQQHNPQEAYGFQSPYITEQGWEGQYSTA